MKKKLSYLFAGLGLLCAAGSINAQTYQNSILVSFGRTACSTSTAPYISLVDKTTGNLLLSCDVSNALGNSTIGSMIEYNPVDNYIYLIKTDRTLNKTYIWKFDVGLASRTFTCPTLSLPTHTYSTTPDMFAINSNGLVYSIGNLTGSTATISKYDFNNGTQTGAVTLQFPTGNIPSTLGSGDITFTADGKLYAVFGSGPSKLYEITNYDGPTATATFLTNVGDSTHPLFGLAFVDGQLQISGKTTSPCSTYTYTYNLSTKTLGSSTTFPNGIYPSDNTSIYEAIGATKQVLKKETVNTNTADITYELFLQNKGNVSLSNAQLTDNLAAIYGGANISNLKVTAVTNSGNLTLNPLFNGNTDINLLAANQTLSNIAPKNSITLNVSMRVTNLDTTKPYNNQAKASGYVGTALKNVTVTNGSNNGPSSTIDPLSQTTPTPFTFDGYCYKKPVTAAGSIPTNHGITALNRAGAASTWPMVRQSAWTALEANTKGFVVNRVPFDATGNPVGIAPGNFKTGMMVYDTTNNCLSIYNGTAWKCFSTPSCPNL